MKLTLIAIGWTLLAYGFVHMGEAWPALLLPAFPLLIGTCFHIGGYAALQDDRDQLDSVLDMFSCPDKWVRLKDNTGEKIPDRVMVHETDNGIEVCVQVGNKLVRYKTGRAYAAKFREKMRLLQDHREMQAIVAHCKELEK